MTEKKSKCKLKLDIGIHVKDPKKVGSEFESIWLDVVSNFGYMPPTEILEEKGGNIYQCRLFLEDKNICKKCPAYQP